MQSSMLQKELSQLIHGENVIMQPSVPVLVQESLSRNEGQLTATGALSVSTGEFTGRSPLDKYIVKDDETKDTVDWGAINQPISPDDFGRLYEKVVSYLQKKSETYVFKGFAGADKEYQLPIQVMTEYAWHNLFAQQLFITPTKEEFSNHEAQFTVLYAPGCKADPVVDGTRSETFIVTSFTQRVVLIGGTEYAGEMKKAIFSCMNYLLPKQNVFPMHCSANIGEEGDVALFFGLSGTGKTTLSADPQRRLIGDDEHGWSSHGIFNIEGGCYAKCIGLTEVKEPQIYRAIQFGAVLENVVLNQDGEPDYDNNTKTDNTRAAYSLQAIDRAVLPSVASQPTTIVFLTADAFGVLPPIAKLTKEQAMYHFLSGYTSKLAGTERGITSPQATFSACFGAPFLPRSPLHYAEQLGAKLDAEEVQVFLVNTGWTGGPYGVGDRMPLLQTRLMIHAALSGELDALDTIQEPVFGLHIPQGIPGVEENRLHPRKTWNDPAEYDEKAAQLVAQFRANFEKFRGVAATIEKAGGPIA
ncbi:phosphoenolpyruvate carboxykinase (ATP) [Bacillus fonticola]|uniref:phosphoenolpyruvate carboxykinase (ATP) n=1 Tax=Bacillus fonticola TaxID=2728853 RepID=UPI001474B531|nr:phosphoenolpyruvate carboxykinase (ATP) [Bacillus fonticola]